ncbi:MAG: hypothetical protein RL095_1535 [Verrucomicrobiota bacterium]|jgi:purine-binding chemotaxis protein CheW
MNTKASSKAQNWLQVVTFGLGDENFAVEITKIKEIIMLESVTKIPQVPSYIEGVINLRGLVVPVIDLRKRFGLASHSIGPDARIMISRLEDRCVGMIVDSVSKVLKIPKTDILEQAESITSMAKDYLLGMAKGEKGILLIVDLEKVLTAPEKADLAQTRF